jgi:hypothetical protein
MTKEEALKDFFNTALKGESKTYNDHNWYSTSGLRGYIQGGGSSPYPLLKKALSEYTIGEIKQFQSRPRDASGQLWATGRYQIIPSTLKGVQARTGLSDSAKYNKEAQDKMAYALLIERKPINDYIKGSVPDTTANLQNAALHMSMIWSSIGVPYAVNGKQVNQSYYASDRASVDTAAVQAKLRELRGSLLSKGLTLAKDNPKTTIAIFVIIALMITAILLLIYRKRIARSLTKM